MTDTIGADQLTGLADVAPAPALALALALALARLVGDFYDFERSC
jgi:hypothetical protein